VVSGSAGSAWQTRVSAVQEIPAALDALMLRRGRPVLVLVGGGDGMDQSYMDLLTTVLQKAVLPLIGRFGAAVVDGGTDSGVMRIMGRARAAAGGRFPLVGVVAEGTVAIQEGRPSASGAAAPESNHSHLILVPGVNWGDESPWLADVADALADGDPSATVVVNGGQITYDDVAGSLSRGRPVLVLAGSGRTADAIVAARSGLNADPRAVEIATSSLTHIVPAGDMAAIAEAVESALRGRV
jgi:SLOG in TRPM, prokaryote